MEGLKNIDDILEEYLESKVLKNNSYISLNLDNHTLFFKNLYNINSLEIVFNHNDSGNYYIKINDKEILKIDTLEIKEFSNRIFNFKLDNCEFNSFPVFPVIDLTIETIEFDKCIFTNNDSTNIQKILFKSQYNLLKYIKFNICSFSKVSISTNNDNNSRDLTKLIIKGGSIKHLDIQNIKIESKFYVNEQYSNSNNLRTKIDKLTIQDTIFKNNVKFHSCDISEVNINNVDFEKIVDFYNSTFCYGVNKSNEILFKSINFNNLALFNNTTFKSFLNFRYVTFLNSVQFSYSNLEQGINLDYTNIHSDALLNFTNSKGLDGKEAIKNTSQESYRIIKYHLQQLGNQIESNKYHSLELNKNRTSLWNKQPLTFNELQRAIVAFLHKVSSNHSNSWFLALFWIFVTAYLTNIFITFEKTGYIFSNLFSFDWKYLSILNEIKDNPKIFLFNKVSLGYLYYQFLTAIRRDTKK